MRVLAIYPLRSSLPRIHSLLVSLIIIKFILPKTLALNRLFPRSDTQGYPAGFCSSKSTGDFPRVGHSLRGETNLPERVALGTITSYETRPEFETSLEDISDKLVVRCMVFAQVASCPIHTPVKFHTRNSSALHASASDELSGRYATPNAACCVPSTRATVSCDTCVYVAVLGTGRIV